MEEAKHGKSRGRAHGMCKGPEVSSTCLNNRRDGGGAEAELVMGRRRS